MTAVMTEQSTRCEVRAEGGAKSRGRIFLFHADSTQLPHWHVSGWSQPSDCMPS